VQTIKKVFIPPSYGPDPAYILDPHSAVGVTAAYRYLERSKTSTDTPGKETHQICLSTAHPAKFSHAVDLALKHVYGYDFSKVLPEEFKGLARAEKRVEYVPKADKELIKEVVERLLLGEKD